jgi:hypothetical protein
LHIFVEPQCAVSILDTILCEITVIKWTSTPGVKLYKTIFLILYYQSQNYFTTDGLSWCRAHSGTCDKMLYFLSQICCLVSMGRPLSREDWSAVCSAITQLSESRRTRNHTSLSHLRLPKPGGPGSRIYIPQEQGGLVIPPGTVFPLRRLLRLAGLQWRYSDPAPHEL